MVPLSNKPKHTPGLRMVKIGPVINNIPIPRKEWRAHGQRTSRYDFIYEMKIGDSFFIVVTRGCLMAMKSRWQKRYSVKLVTRSLAEDGVDGFRVWRVEDGAC